MNHLDLETLVIDYDADGPCCVRLPTDPELQSSLNPIVETVLLSSDEIRELCADHDSDEQEELRFE